MDQIVIIGAGHAGAATAARLRALGYRGALTLLGEEPDAPYHRPPLSKDYLLGKTGRERLWLRNPAFYADNAIALVTGCRAEAIDRTRRVVEAGGRRFAYDALVLATGARARRLPAGFAGGDGANVFTLRRLADIDRLAPALHAARRLLIVGGGYIGLEAAAVARGLGREVTLLEGAPRILQRVACAETAAHLRALHQARGTRVVEGATLARFESAGGQVTAAHLADGRRIACDLVILGIGVQPCTELAEAAGIGIDDGIATDDRGRTDAAGIWAAGDCASFPWQGRRIRLESVQNATDQAQAVAANILGADTPYAPVPWFWSDQFETKLQIAGLGGGHDRLVTRRTQRGLSHWYFRGETLLAVDAIDDPRAYMSGRRLLEAGRSPDPTRLPDPEFDPGFDPAR